jgi:membrane protease YdiL (CAAX protease family)
VEELLFRGVLFALARRAWGGGSATAVSSTAFALAHAALYPWPVLLLGLVAGLLLGLWRLASDDLAGPILAHALADAAAGAALGGL